MRGYTDIEIASVRTNMHILHTHTYIRKFPYTLVSAVLPVDYKFYLWHTISLTQFPAEVDNGCSVARNSPCLPGQEHMYMYLAPNFLPKEWVSEWVREWAVREWAGGAWGVGGRASERVSEWASVGGREGCFYRLDFRE